MRALVAVAAVVAAGCASGGGQQARPLEEPPGLQADAAPAVVARTQMVQADVADAQRTLAGGAVDRASSHVDGAAEALASIRMDAPGGKLLRDIDDIGVRLLPGEKSVVDLGPLEARVKAESPFLDPEVVKSLAAARPALQAGHNAEAFQTLKAARERLARDIGVNAVDEALTKLARTKDALRGGRLEEARRLLAEVPPAVDAVAREMPLVPVRFDLRAAAAEADAGVWDRARLFVQRAASRLEQIQGSAHDPSGELPDLLERTRALDRALDEKPRPRPASIRELADRTATPVLPG